MSIDWDDECLKALVASRVFGWRVEYKGGGGVDKYAWKVYGDFLPAPRLCHRVESRAWLPVPDYPNDIAAAWQVIDWMIERGWQVGLRSYKNGKWCVSIYDLWERNFGKRLVHRYVLSAPRAICEAALRALEAAGGD